jgi:transposase InsO family protein
MRLQVPPLVGPVVDPLVPTKEPQESTTVTPAEIVYHRRVQVLDHAGQTSVTEACRTFGVSRTSSDRWAGRAQRYGLAALLPKDRRPPVMPTATPPDQVEAVLAEADARPTIGARRLVDYLADRGVRPSASRRSSGATASAGAPSAWPPWPSPPPRPPASSPPRPSKARSGSATSPPAPATWSPWTPSPSASPKASGALWQLTAVDTATRYAVARLVAGDTSARDAAAFVDHVAERLAGIGAELTGVLSDNGPGFTSKTFTEHLNGRGVRHHRIPPRSPNHNAVCERFQGTALQEFYRPAFHRQHFARLADLNAQFQGWLQHYNTRRPNRSDFMRGRTPLRRHGGPPTMTAPRAPATSTRALEALELSEEVAEAVPGERAFLEPIVEQVAEPEPLSERGQALADVA